MRGKRTNKGAPGAEVDLLREIRRRAALSGRRPGLRLGIGDDCAVLGLAPGEELAVTTDLSIAGRHFRMDWHPPESVGHRTLARGLSDLASMGARPVAAFLSLGVPRELTVTHGRARAWVDGFFDGLFRLAQTHTTPLAGGDLAESPVALADIVLLGAVPAGKALLRSGARPGDLLYVTGALGGAAAGLAELEQTAASGRRSRADRLRLTPRLRAHLFPQPRVVQGLALQRRRLAAAAIDLSDGLSTDLHHLCAESGVAAVIQQNLLPVAPGASLDQALHGGEDYELLFAARPSIRMPRSLTGVPITRIGEVTRRKPSQPPVFLASSGKVAPLDPRGWEHFSPNVLVP
jgi:thiamine-monophosphate kinase